MKADKKKLKNTSDYELLQEIDAVREELESVMYEPSWARTKKLLEYKDDLLRELLKRGIK